MSALDDRQLEELLKYVRSLPPMTGEQKEEQALDFAYGQLGASTNHKPNRGAFKKLAADRGWTEERFEAWARKRRWYIGRMLMDVPERTAAHLAVLRRESVEMTHPDGWSFGEPKGGFTCDNCGARFTCAFVFDLYNTDGDCLAEK